MSVFPGYIFIGCF